MPTGYTCRVQSGETTTLEQFALHCARNFGACIPFREESSDFKIPDTIEPDGYYFRRIAESKEELRAIEQVDFSEEAMKQRYLDYATESEAKRVARLAEAKVEYDRYNAMRIMIQATEPPTPEHRGLWDFMLSQIEDSIKWDCDLENIERSYRTQTFEEWSEGNSREELIIHQQQEIELYQKRLQEEVERCEDRTRWIQSLRAAVLGK